MHIYDIQSAKVVGKPLTHAVAVQQIALSAGPLRFLAIVDANRSLYITPVLRSDWKVGPLRERERERERERVCVCV